MKNIIEILEEVKIGDVILEAGDRIKVLEKAFYKLIIFDTKRASTKDILDLGGNCIEEINRDLGFSLSISEAGFSSMESHLVLTLDRKFTSSEADDILNYCRKNFMFPDWIYFDGKPYDANSKVAYTIDFIPEPPLIAFIKNSLKELVK